MAYTPEDKLRILMVGPDRSVHGGISAVVNSYYEAGLGDITDLHYIGTMKEGSKPYKLLVALRAYFQFRRELAWADIVHVHVASDNSFRRKSVFIRLAHKRGKRIIIHQHGGDFVRYHDEQVSVTTRAKMDEILNMADYLLVLGQRWKDYFSTIVPEERIRIVHNGIKVTDDDSSRYTDVVHDMNKVLFLGRICADKGLNELIDAIANLKKDYPELELLLGGCFEEKTDADRMLRIRVENNSDFIRHLGWIDGEEKENALLESGIYALPSYYEGFPVSVPEAMYYGCITIASDVGSIPEIIEDHVTGLIVKARDVLSLSSAIRQLMDGSVDIESIREKAHLQVASKYSMHEICHLLKLLYDSLAGQRMDT